MSEPKQPRVFISYSWDDEAHKAKVKTLTNYLRGHGIDVELDKYQQGDKLWDDWMQNCINTCDYIFVICSEKYKESFKGSTSKSTGVYKEAIKIKNLLNKSHDEATLKIKALFFGDINEDHIPEELIRCDWVNCIDQHQLNDLYQKITLQKEKAPELGNLVKELPSESPFSPSPVQATQGQVEPVMAVNLQNTNSEAPPFFVPYESKGKGAIGIEDKLKEVHEAITNSKKTSIGQGASFQGIGGLGKTQLAVEYAHRYRDQYNGVVWITVDQDIDVQLLELAEKSKWVEINVDAKAKMAIAKERYAELNNTLLVFDNVDNYQEIKPLFPKLQNNILITSRSDIQGFPTVPLEILNEENALKLLASESNRKIEEGELASAKTLVEKFDGLPLALEMAGAYVAHLALSWNDYLTLFKKKGLAFIDKADIRGSTNHESNIQTTLSLSDELLEKTDHLKNIINLLAWGANEAVDKALMGKMLGETELELIEPISIALKLKIIKKEDNDSFVLHRLVREVWKTQRRLNSEFAEIVAQCLANYMESIQEEFLHLRKLERAAIQAMIWKDHINRPDIQAALLGSSAFPEYHMGKYKRALTYIDDALRLVSNTDDSQVLADLLNYKGSLTDAVGDAKSAKSFFEEALEMRQRLYPKKDHSDIATSLVNMGNVLGSLGDFKKAKPFYEDALEMRQRLYPKKDNLKIANSLTKMGAVLNSLGDSTKAKLFSEDALEMLQRLYPKQDHPNIASVLTTMGDVLNSLGDTKRAKLFSEDALEMLQRLYPKQDHPNIAYLLNNLGKICFNSKMCLKAQKCVEEALHIFHLLDIEPIKQQALRTSLKRINKSIKMQKKPGARKGRFCKDM